MCRESYAQLTVERLSMKSTSRLYRSFGMCRSNECSKRAWWRGITSNGEVTLCHMLKILAFLGVNVEVDRVIRRVKLVDLRLAALLRKRLISDMRRLATWGRFGGCVAVLRNRLYRSFRYMTWPRLFQLRPRYEQVLYKTLCNPIP